MSMCVYVCVCVFWCEWVCDIMAGQRGQREIAGVETQRYSLAFIITQYRQGQKRREG